MPAFRPGVSWAANFVGGTDAITRRRTSELILLANAASGGRHMGMTVGAYAPGQAMSRRMPAEEVKKELEQDDDFSGRLTHAASQVSVIFVAWAQK